MVKNPLFVSDLPIHQWGYQGPVRYKPNLRGGRHRPYWALTDGYFSIPYHAAHKVHAHRVTRRKVNIQLHKWIDEDDDPRFNLGYTAWEFL